MNSAPIFNETRPEVLHALMREHPFATLVGSRLWPAQRGARPARPVHR